MKANLFVRLTSNVLILWLLCHSPAARAQELPILPPDDTNSVDVLDMSALSLPADAQPTVVALSWSNSIVIPDEYTVIVTSDDLATWYPTFELVTTPTAVVFLASTNSQLFFRLYNKIGQ